MKKLQKEFLDFDDAIKIGSETPTLIEKREKLKKSMEDNFPDECRKYGIDLKKSDLRFIHQGSYKIGTTIKQKTDSKQSIDLDYAVFFPLDKEEHSDPRKLKKAAKSALEIKNKRIPVIKEPCVTVGYHSNDEEIMHIDFPLYAEYNSELYLARGKETSDNYDWEIADPEGLNDYFLTSFSEKPQLKRVVRYLKRWKQEQYFNSSRTNEVPPSIGLTILACQNYVEFTKDGDDDLSSLFYTMKAIRDTFSIVKDVDGHIVSANIICNLPVVPNSDVFYKMTDNYKITFYNRLNKAVENLNEAVNLSEDHEAAKYVQKVLGDDFTVPEKNASSFSVRNKGEYSFGKC